MFKLDYSPRHIRLVLAAIMQVEALEPHLLSSAQWYELRKYFEYHLINPALDRTMSNEVALFLKHVFHRWEQLGDYPERMVKLIIED